MRVQRRVVDAAYLEGAVPASSPPPFDVEPGARCAPVGELASMARHADGYVVVGGGKTGMDACSWLLETGVPADAVRWIKPRESWLLESARLNLLCGLGARMAEPATARSHRRFLASVGRAGPNLRRLLAGTEAPARPD